jgi:RNA polymerase sigma-70 factor (ECF subfamily)
VPTPAPGARGSAAEAETVAALRAGDEHSFQQLFTRLSPGLKRMARGYVTSDAIADEIVQETWLAVINGIDRFQGRSSLNTWIFSILINQARKHDARERRAMPFSSLTPSDTDGPSVDADRFQTDHDTWPGHWATPPRPWQTPERRLLSLEARAHLKHAIGHLPERQRAVVVLRDVEGHSADEVCALLQLSPENQRVLLHRARTRLRNALAAYAGEAA